MAAAVVLGLAGCGGAGSGSAASGAGQASASDQLNPSVKTDFKTDFARHNVPLSQFQSGGPGRDGIPPVDHPKYVSEAKADRFLSAREPVIAVTQGAATRAYPVQVLIWHEIVNDTLAGRPIAVTYCPLCNSTLVFDRRAAGRTLTFGTTGNLRNSDLVMWDRQTQSWWQQFSGQAVVGSLTGTTLQPIDAQTLSWADFKQRYPQADVLSRDTGFSRPYGTNPYSGYDQPKSKPFLYSGRIDPRLPPLERVAAVTVGGETVVVPFTKLAKHPVVTTDVGHTKAVVLYRSGVVSPLDAQSIRDSRDVGTVGAFDRRLGSRTLSFSAQAGGFHDHETGSAWDITGHAFAGPLAGSQLRPLSHDEQFWFALAAFLPHARLI